jgi:adenine phosphoribosyltransferase
MKAASMNLKDHIAHIPDFPNPGILFYDISPMLAHGAAWRSCISRLADYVTPHAPDVLIGIESRGFLVVAPLAIEIGCGFIMVRKNGKLPGPTVGHTYDLEYGTDTIEMQSASIEPGQRVVIMDDLLATGGTMAAAIILAQKLGGDVRAACCIIELTFLGGREKLDVPFDALLTYEE